MNTQLFYNDYLYKKLKPKSDVLKDQQESKELELSKTHDIGGLYSVDMATQENVWVCGRVYSENAGGGGGKLNEHNVSIQGSYLFSNSRSIQLNLANCNEYSLFPGQIIMTKGRNPDGKRFVCQEIIEPNFAPVTRPVKKEPHDQTTTATQFLNSRDPASISVPLEQNEQLKVAVVSGPFMQWGSIVTTPLTRLIDQVKAKNVHVLFILGPLIDLNHDYIASGLIESSYDELLQSIFDDIAAQFRNTKIQVIIQPSLNDITQDPIYPVAPFNIPNSFLRQNENIHLVPEPSMIKINEIQFALTTTDVIKDLLSISVSKSHSSDKISRNFTHLLKQGSFYPIYPPPDHVCIDYEAWQKYAQIDVMPKVFIAVSDLATFNKEVNNCVCVNPGRLVRGSATGGFAQLIFPAASSEKPEQNDQETKGETKPNINVTFHKI